MKIQKEHVQYKKVNIFFNIFFLLIFMSVSHFEIPPQNEPKTEANDENKIITHSAYDE